MLSQEKETPLPLSRAVSLAHHILGVAISLLAARSEVGCLSPLALSLAVVNLAS